MGTALLSPADRLKAIITEIAELRGNIDAHRARIGELLKTVLADRLYLKTHTSFGAFVQATLGISRQRAYQLAFYADVSTFVDNEAQARELAGFDSDVQLEALDAVGENKSAAALRAALQKADVTATRDAEKDAASSHNRREPRDIWDGIEAREEWFRKTIKRKFRDVAARAEAQLDALIRTLRSSGEG